MKRNRTIFQKETRRGVRLLLCAAAIALLWRAALCASELWLVRRAALWGGTGVPPWSALFPQAAGGAGCLALALMLWTAARRRRRSAHGHWNARRARPVTPLPEALCVASQPAARHEESGHADSDENADVSTAAQKLSEDGSNTAAQKLSADSAKADAHGFSAESPADTGAARQACTPNAPRGAEKRTSLSGAAYLAQLLAGEDALSRRCAGKTDGLRGAARACAAALGVFEVVFAPVRAAAAGRAEVGVRRRAMGEATPSEFLLCEPWTGPFAGEQTEVSMNTKPAFWANSPRRRSAARCSGNRTCCTGFGRRSEQALLWDAPPGMSAVRAKAFGAAGKGRPDSPRGHPCAVPAVFLRRKITHALQPMPP